MIKRIPLFVICIALLSTPAARAQTGAGDDTWLREVLGDPVPRWRSLLDTLNVPGAAIAVVRQDGSLFIQGLGYRNLASSAPVTGDTRFYIASTTKPFVAFAAAMLEHGGTLDLNRPVRTYLPQFQLADRTESRTITVRDLLAHRRGLQDHAITFGEAYTGQMTEERFYRLLKQVRAVGELDYSNLHYTLVGRVIEAVTDTTWKSHLASSVFAPLGMSRTATIVSPLTSDSNAARPYQFVRGSFQPARLKTDRTMHAAGGMISTASDLARWIAVHLNDGRLAGVQVFPASVIREMQKVQIYEEEPSPVMPDHKRVGWGLGWDIREDRKSRMLYHSGSYEGWYTHMSFMPEVGIGMVVLTNADGVAAQIAAEIIAANIYDHTRGLAPRNILPRVLSFLQSSDASGTKGAGADAPKGRPSTPLARYVGVYENEDWGTLTMTLDGGALSARIGDFALPLVWLGSDTFVADGDHKGTVKRHRSGTVTSVLLSDLLDEGLVEFVRK